MRCNRRSVRVEGRKARPPVLPAWLLAAGMAMCMSAHAVDLEEDGQQVGFIAPVSIRSAGEPVIGEISGVQGALAAIVRERLQALEYLPAFGEVGVDREAYVEGRVLLVPSGADDYEVRLQDLAVRSARPVSTPKPRYPSDEFQRRRSGHVELLLDIDGEGRVVESTTISARSRSFEKAARDAVADWTFETRGRPVRMTVPFWFYREGSDRKAPPDYACAVPEGEPRLKGQSGCETVVEVVLVQMRSTEGAIRR